MGFGEFESEGVTFSGQTVNVRSAGVRETHNLGAFIEGFAGGIVDSLAEDFHFAGAFDPNNLGVAAGNKEAEEREFGDFLFGGFADEMG